LAPGLDIYLEYEIAHGPDHERNQTPEPAPEDDLAQGVANAEWDLHPHRHPEYDRGLDQGWSEPVLQIAAFMDVPSKLNTNWPLTAT
jgi:hypothetical protein